MVNPQNLSSEFIDPPAPAKRKYKARKPKAKAPAKLDRTVIDEGIFAGITDQKCPDACTLQQCVISTVNVCKHPCMAPVTGCGPITIANRTSALKILKLKKLVKDE